MVSVQLLKSFYGNKGKDYPRTGHEGPEWEQRYSSTLSLTSELDGMGGQRHAPDASPPGKARHPLYRSLSGPHSRSGQLRKISPPPGFDPRTVNPVVTRYTNCAIPAPLFIGISFLFTPAFSGTQLGRKTRAESISGFCLISSDVSCFQDSTKSN